MGGQLWALIELGDLGCLSWLEEVAESMAKDDPRYVWVLEQITRIRAQHDSALLLELLQSGASYVESSWLLRQGVRNGVDVALLRQAVLDQVAKAENGSLRMKEKSIVGQVGLEFGVLMQQDISEHSIIKPLKIADEGQGPKWATLVEVRRTQFYRGKSKDE